MPRPVIPCQIRNSLRFDLEAFSGRGTFKYQDTAEALLLDHWSGEGGDGVVEHGLVRYAECGAGVADQQAHGPWRTCRSTVVVRAPKLATVMRFSWAELTWEWTVPAAD